MVSGVSVAAKTDHLCSQLAGELALRHNVLFWDTTSLIKTAKTTREVSPFCKTFSPVLLRNFLSQPSQSLHLLRGPLEGPRVEQDDMARLLKDAFDYLFVLSGPTWDLGYLNLLDHAKAVLLIGTSAPHDLTDLHRHLEEFARHKYPRALGQVVITHLQNASAEFLAECERKLDHPLLAALNPDFFSEHVRSLAQLLGGIHTTHTKSHP